MNSNQALNTLSKAEAAANKAQNTPDKEARREAFLKKKEELNHLYTDSLEKMRQGDSNLFQDFLNTAAKFSASETFKNLVLLAAERPDATLVQPGYVWKKKGAKLPAKDKAIYLLIKGAMWTDQKKGTTGFYYDPKECYDVADLEGIRLVESAMPAGDHSQTIAAICMVLENPQKYQNGKAEKEAKPVTFCISETQTENARYDPATSTISVRKDLPPKDCCESVIMEMCHRERYLGGWESNRRTHDDMFIAYAATYVICRKLSLPAEDFDFPADFLVEENVDSFERKLRSIVKTADSIGERLDTAIFEMVRSQGRSLETGSRAIAASEPVQGV